MTTEPTPDRVALRDRIAEVLRPHASLGGTPPRYELPFFDGATPGLPRISGWKPLDDVADAVLAVLPDRDAIVAEAEAKLAAGCPDHGPNGGWMMTCQCEAIGVLRDLAAEAPTTTKPETEV